MEEQPDPDLPSSVSDQNREQAEPGHGGGEKRDPRADDTKPGSESGGGRDSGGEAGEGSQSTGDPHSAG